MREIKFRAWDKHEEIMIYSEETDYPYNWGLGFYGIEVQECDGIYWNTMKDLEFMQYTGLKDKNDKEIYEGDIVKTIDIVGDEIQGAVEYDEAGYYIHTKSQWNPSLRLNYENHEVIGNIHEHKHFAGGALMDNIKLPLGIMPRAIWIETRLDNIEDAINRIFREAYLYPIPIDWIEEYNDLIEELNKLDAKNKGLEATNAD